MIDTIDYRLLSLINAAQAHAFHIIPYLKNEQGVYFYTSVNPTAHTSQLAMIMGCAVFFEQIEPNIFEPFLYKYYPIQQRNEKRQNEALTQDSDIIRFIDKMLSEAVEIRASDIHIERYESFARIRFRWEGQLVEKYEIPVEKYGALINRVKILSDMDISERRLPQDGRIHVAFDNHKIDIRVSIVPGKFGEKAVLRLLTRSMEFLSLDNLGMNPFYLTLFLRAIQQPNGIVLITGPTGSGKTTSLYAALNILNKKDKNIVTIEDPIEYNIEGINQLQVKEEIGLGFDTALRAYLRQDPDIIMIGEIRDPVTAEIAIRSALTGHLVLSTLHTNSALDAIGRLMDMQIPPYLIAASLRMVVAQRLIRILCQHCKKESREVIDQEIQLQYSLELHSVPHGCPKCNYTGYSHRKAIYEFLPITPIFASYIKQNMNTSIDLYQEIPHYQSLKDEVQSLLNSGQTSLTEGMSYLV